MDYILRIIGFFWILIAARPTFALLKRLIETRLDYSVGLAESLNAVMLAGGIGLLLLKEWGRVVVRLGTLAFLLIQIVQQIMQLRWTLGALSPLIYNAVFIAILSLPQAKSSTQN